MQNEVQIVERPDGVEIYKFKDIKTVHEGEWYDIIQKMKQECDFQEVLNNMSFDVGIYPNQDNFKSDLYYLNAINMNSPFSDETIEACLDVLLYKGFEVLIKFDNDFVVIFVEKNERSDNVVEQLFIQERIDDCYLI